MGISQIISVVALSLTGLLPASCQKTSSQQKSSPPAAVAHSNTTNANDIFHNLGEVELTNHYETCVQLGGGKHCTLTPKMLNQKYVLITLSVESKTAAGKTHDLSVTQVVTRTGKPLEVAVGDFELTLTPRVNLE